MHYHLTCQLTKVFYLFKVVNNIDFSRVSGICLWNSIGFRVLLGVDFNFLFNLFNSITYFEIVLVNTFLRNQRGMYLEFYYTKAMRFIQFIEFF